jgi:hypothetical protein
MEENQTITTTTITTTTDTPTVVPVVDNTLKTTPILGGMLEDESGGTSTMRVFTLCGGGFILLLWGFVVIWNVCSGMPIPDIPLQWSIAFGALIAGKVGQKYFETKT